MVWGVSVSLNLTVSLCAVLRRSQIAVLAIADWERFCANVSVEMVGTRSREAGQQPRHRVSAYMEAHWAISPFLGPRLKLIAPVSSADAPHVSGFIFVNQCTRGKHFKARSAAHMEL